MPSQDPVIESTAIMKTNSTVNVYLADGWVHQPNGRGTLDIIQSCLLTVFLCSWSVLCLNVPAQSNRRWSFLLLKINWMVFTIFFPEVVVAFAAEQWESACQSVDDFAKLGYPQWTMRHAFLADMGGFLLQSPDFPVFPVDGQQLVYLVNRKYLPHPDIDQETIRDKNKADGFARIITLIQIAWFTVQCIARLIQHIALSTFELSTLAFIFCSLNMFFFWFHKPLDVGEPIVLHTDIRIADILLEAGDRARKPYKSTPLDFLNPPERRTSIIALCKFGLGVLFGFDKETSERPVKTFVNSRTTPYRGITVREMLYGVLIELTYFGIHLAAWNFTFPTRTERLLWRVASLQLLGVLLFYLAVITIGTYFYKDIARILFGKESNSMLGVASLAPQWLLLVAYYPVIIAYGSARTYILLEAFVNLRALPLSAYTSVNWADFIPHV